MKAPLLSCTRWPPKPLAHTALPPAPAPGANTGVSGSTEPIQPVMSRMARFCAPKPERSATMIWFGVTTNGLPDVFTRDRPALNWAVLRIQLPGPKLTVSAPPPKSTRPPNRAPGSTVRMSEAAAPKALNRIAVPLLPMIVPEVATLPVVPTRMPMPSLPAVPEIVPELNTVALLASMPAPKPLAPAVPEMVPELVTVALTAAMPTPKPWAPPVPEMVLELVTVALSLEWMPKPLSVPVPEMAPKLVTEPVLKNIPLASAAAVPSALALPVTVAPRTTVVFRLSSVPLPKPLGGFWLRVVSVQVAVTLLPASGAHLACAC